MAEQVIFFRVQAEGVGDLVDQLGLLRREATQLQKDMRKATDPAEYVKLNRELENNRAAQKATTAAIKEQQKATQQAVQFAEGSYAQLNQQLVGLRKEIKQLSAADRESKLGQTMLANIQKLDAELKDLDASMGQYQRNVGNYESAFSGFAGTLLQIGAVAEVAQFFDPNALIQQGIAIDNLDAKAKTVFGETLPRVTKEAEKNASAMGLTTR
jgi:chromosome segregation ATPase